jgi:hypothetical protein
MKMDRTMKKTVFALLATTLLSLTFAKAPLSEDAQREVLALDRKENAAYVKLQQAEQDELMGKISSKELDAARKEYDEVKEKLQSELSKLGNRPEIEKWLIDNHVRVGM